MNGLRDRVSRLLYDSSNSTNPNSAPPKSQTRPSSKREKSFSSYFSFIKSSTAIKRVPSAPATESYGWKPLGTDEEEDNNGASGPPSPIHEEDETRKARQEDGGCGSDRSSSYLDVAKKSVHQQSPQKALTNLLDDSVFITPELYEFFQSTLPNIVKGCQWALLYSTLKHGISLNTLIRKSAELSGPCLLIVGDMEGAIFGGMLECPLKPTPKWKYQGTNQTFVFTTIYGEPRLFRPTGANRYYYLCLNDLLALGGGGTFALRLNEDLLSGTSGSCATFGNSCLAHKPEFQIKNIELWGFTHASQYT